MQRHFVSVIVSIAAPKKKVAKTSPFESVRAKLSKQVQQFLYSCLFIDICGGKKMNILITIRTATFVLPYFHYGISHFFCIPFATLLHSPTNKNLCCFFSSTACKPAIYFVFARGYALVSGKIVLCQMKNRQLIENWMSTAHVTIILACTISIQPR